MAGVSATTTLTVQRMLGIDEGRPIHGRDGSVIPTLEGTDEKERVALPSERLYALARTERGERFRPSR